MINVLVFEDERVAHLHPITTARPAFAISCACRRLSDWLETAKANIVCEIRSYLESIAAADFPFFANELDPTNASTLLINARIAPSKHNFGCLDTLTNWLTTNVTTEFEVVAVDQNQNPIAYAVPTSCLLDGRRNTHQIVAECKRADAKDQLAALDSFHYPHDVIDLNQKHFSDNLLLEIERPELKEIGDGVYAHESATVDSKFVANTKSGPVVFDKNSKIGPYTFFEGPVFVGPNCKVLEHASIKDFVYLTNTVKAGGEIEASIIEPFSNKQHHGFLGHSYLGSWINIGAGTCNSDLKNTYGKVNTTYGQQKISTNMQFVGCFIGDYSKTAINTSIFTGKSIGVCSMLYGFVTSNVPGFVNYAKTLGDVTGVPADVMVTTQQRMFGRRGIKQRPEDVQLIKDMFDQTARERDSLDLSYDSPNF